MWKSNTTEILEIRLGSGKRMDGVFTLIKQLEWVRDQCHLLSIITCCLRKASKLDKLSYYTGTRKVSLPRRWHTLTHASGRTFDAETKTPRKTPKAPLHETRPKRVPTLTVSPQLWSTNATTPKHYYIVSKQTRFVHKPFSLIRRAFRILLWFR